MDATLVRSSERLQAYSDAIFSIVATIMILPVAHSEIPENEALGGNFVNLLLPKIAVYIYTFLVVCTFWTTHTWLFTVIEQVDEIIVLINLAFMMVTTFLPFTFTLLSFNVTSPLAIQLFCVSIFLSQVLQLFAIVHAFRHPETLHEELQFDENRNKERNKMILKVVTPACIAILAGIMSFASSILAVVLLLLFLLSNYIRRGIVLLYHRLRACVGRHDSPQDIQQQQMEDSLPLRHRLLNETLTKDRIIFFSDGVFAIVATLIILDICENNIPTAEEVTKCGGLLAALEQYSHIFFAYWGTFMSVAMLWYVHHSLLHYVKEFNILMALFNNLSLLSVGLSPLSFQLISDFERHKSYNNESIAIQLNCMNLFFAGLFQALIWVVALFQSERCLLPAARHGGNAHGYISAKLAVYPLLSLTMYFVSVFGKDVQTMAFVTTQVCTVGLFIVLGLLFTQVQKVYRFIFWRGIDPPQVDVPSMQSNPHDDFEETRSHSPITA